MNRNLSGKAGGWVGGRTWGTSPSTLLLCGIGEDGRDITAEEGHGVGTCSQAGGCGEPGGVSSQGVHDQSGLPNAQSGHSEALTGMGGKPEPEEKAERQAVVMVWGGRQGEEMRLRGEEGSTWQLMA